MPFTVHDSQLVRGPLVVIGAAPRSGTTLIQRLITSSKNAICLGEAFAGRIFTLSSWVDKNAQLLSENTEKNDADWETLKRGDTDFWMPGLELPGGQSTAALSVALSAYSQFLAACANNLQKPIWGFKSPNHDLEHVALLAKHTPNLKCIFVYRNIFDVVRSSKSRGWCDTPQKLRDICLSWCRRTKVIAGNAAMGNTIVSNDLCVLKYEEMVDDIGPAIRQMEEFAGIEGIRRETADVKINTWPGSGTLKTRYIEPSELNSQEITTIEEVCGDALRLLYPELKQPELS